MSSSKNRFVCCFINIQSLCPRRFKIIQATFWKTHFIMVNSYVAFSSDNRSGSGVVFHKILCDTDIQKLWLIAFKPSKPFNLKVACVCCFHFLEKDYYPNYKLQSKSIDRSAKRKGPVLVYCTNYPISKIPHYRLSDDRNV